MAHTSEAEGVDLVSAFATLQSLTVATPQAQQRCGADQAFAQLRACSQNTNRQLRDVAADLIERVSGAPA